jgi:hypothetical protein
VPRLLLAGSSSVVHTTARNRFGAPVPGVSVRMIGPGVDQRATTNRNGVARFTVTSARKGLIQFKGGALRAPTAAIAVCRTLLGVVKPAALPITG